MTKRVLVTGATGFIGGRLAARLASSAREVRCLVRDRSGSRARALERAGFDLHEGDVLRPETLRGGGHGVDVAYYLIHSMGRGGSKDFAASERAAAAAFARMARAEGIERVIYLGGLGDPPHSQHLRSRLEVERILLEAAPCSVALRASIVIGARSRSFRFLVRLVERLPVLALPAWRTNRTAPIDERDMLELLTRAAVSDSACGQVLDAGGPDIVTYGELIERIRFHMLVDRPTISLNRIPVTPIASRVASVIASEEHELIGPLLEGLATDLLPRDDRALPLLGVRAHSLDAAIERSLREWEREEPLRALAAEMQRSSPESGYVVCDVADTEAEHNADVQAGGRHHIRGRLKEVEHGAVLHRE